ncbi:MAG TPA: rhomboid family intramembrane serine protease [Ignavibacteriaceae bacterium]|nr:rhomboid family intramembrane serine protease [Ignavibacteriaceae bacterium]
MLFPIGDDNRERNIIPYINYLIILANIFVFVFLQDLGGNEKFTYKFSTVPEEIVTGKDIVTHDQTYENPETGERYTIPGLGVTPVSVYLTLLTSIFMHGSIAHIFGNMLFLWIFGDNIENKTGHLRYLIFYLVCGVLASLAHVYSTYFLGGDPLIPTIGASGAISGVLGAYLLLFPKKRVSVIMFYFITDMPAIMVIGIWFLFQIVSGLGLLGGGVQGGGVAYGAHVGGFISGLILIKFFSLGR